MQAASMPGGGQAASIPKWARTLACTKADVSTNLSLHKGTGGF